jgi:putative SOS response-associated peptidase YedK
MGGYMCGRFTQKFTWPELVELYRLTQTPPNLRPNYNLCPTDPASVIFPGDKGLFLMPMRWGLVPRWWKKSLKELPATFNARAEAVAEKPMFRDAFKRNRCLIPASGYFEWHTSGKNLRTLGHGYWMGGLNSSSQPRRMPCECGRYRSE